MTLRDRLLQMVQRNRFAAKLVENFHRISRRERALGAALLAVAATQLFFAASDWSANNYFRLADERTERVRLEALAGAAADDTTALQVAKGLTDAKGWAFKGRTIEIARVSVQRALRTAGENADIQRLTVNPVDAPIGTGTIVLHRMSVEGVFDWDGFLAFADALSNSPQGFYIETFAVSGGRTPLFRLIITAPATIEREEAAA